MREAASNGIESTEIDVVRTSKYVWTVSGTFEGRRIIASAASKRSAISRWRKEAESRVD